MISVDKEYVSYFKVWEIYPLAHHSKKYHLKMIQWIKSVLISTCFIELIWGLQINTSKKFKTVPAHAMCNISIKYFFKESFVEYKGII